VQVQTEAEDIGLALPEELRFDGWSAPPEVLEFLRRCAPFVESQLNKNSSSTAFADYSMDIGLEDDEDAGCVVERSLRLVQADEIEASHAATRTTSSGHSTANRGLQGIALPCQGVAWNCTGNLIVAGFGDLHHAGWCNHKSGVAVYDAFSRSARATAAASESGVAGVVGDMPAPASSAGAGSGLLGTGSSPVDTFLECNCCICSVACHPDAPSVVAAGTFNGEVIVWDISKADDMVMARSKTDDYFHREAVVAISWVYEPQSAQYLLASCSGDGKVLFWTLQNGLANPLHGHFLTGKIKRMQLDIDGDSEDDHPRRKNKRASRNRDDSDDEVAARAKRNGATNSTLGATAMAFPAGGRAVRTFIVGTENGGVQRCQSSIHPSMLEATSSSNKDASKYLRAGGVVGADTTMPWEKAAAVAISSVPVTDRAQISRAVERFARESSAAFVSLATLYAARADGRCLYPNPIDFSFAPHDGAVLGAAMSPFNRHLFATAGEDGHVKLFSTLSRAPLLDFQLGKRDVITSAFGVAWSKARPCVFGAVSADGSAAIFDIYASTAKPAAFLQSDGTYVATGASMASSLTSPSAASIAALSLSFNPVQRRLVVVGDSAGRVRVWKLGWSLASPQPEEERALNILASSAIDEESAASATAATRAAAAQAEGAAELVNALPYFLHVVAAKESKARDLL
jgi:WD40 repeat protein